MKLILGNCIEVLKSYEADQFDSVVTDPPYGLEFMNRDFDGAKGFRRSLNKEGPGSSDYKLHRLFQKFTYTWACEVLRVLKPGGHLLAFGGSRTYHRIASGIEDAGFEIRDQIMWVYGSGFPKSLDVSKAIDKAAGAERKVSGTKIGQPGYSLTQGGEKRHSLNAANDGSLRNPEAECAITEPATDAAKQWDGWGTALKPAHEPIVVARKPLIGTVSQNVLLHGTGALNIDGCRVGSGKDKIDGGCAGTNALHDGGIKQRAKVDFSTGRWPANLIHDGSDEVLDEFAKYGERASPKPYVRGAGSKTATDHTYGKYGGRVGCINASFGDIGTAARFFYCAKASKKERGVGNDWPTVKPLELMRYLCRLVTPPGGRVLDPFVGSGTTGLAALSEGFRFVGIDSDKHALQIACSRAKK
jgi:DNA modification methylase